MSAVHDLTHLFDEYARGQISAENLRILEVALRDDAGQRAEFIEYMNVDSALADLAALSEDELAEIEASERITDSPLNANQAYGRPILWGSAVVAVAAAVLIMMGYWPTGSVTGPAVATLVSGVDAKLLREGQLCVDTDLLAGQYELAQGLLHLRFINGVMVYVEAPARFHAVSGKRLVLQQGRLSASVPLEGIGFTVETPEVEVVDFGTEFSIDVAAGASEVHVFEGLVRVLPKIKLEGQPSDALELVTSEAVKVENNLARPVEIELAADRFIRSFSEPQRKLCRLVKDLKPLAYYRMPIKRGFICEPPEHGGELLLGQGLSAPRAPGVLGGALLVGGQSAGRGAIVISPPQWKEPQLSMSVFVYPERQIADSAIVSNLERDVGGFRLAVNEHGVPQVTIYSTTGELVSCVGSTPLPTRQWSHILVVVDEAEVRLFLDGEPIGTRECAGCAHDVSGPLWVGTDDTDSALWQGRIDELALYGRALLPEEEGKLHRIARETIRARQAFSNKKPKKSARKSGGSK